MLYDVEICIANVTRDGTGSYFDNGISYINEKQGKRYFLRNFRIEILFTIWLTVVAAIAMGFIISSIAKSGDKAMTAAPFVLIIQLLFSGILFNLEGMAKISYCTVSRWSVEALGSIARLNKLELKMQADFPMLEHKAESFFKASKCMLYLPGEF